MKDLLWGYFKKIWIRVVVIEKFNNYFRKDE